MSVRSANPSTPRHTWASNGLLVNGFRCLRLEMHDRVACGERLELLRAVLFHHIGGHGVSVAGRPCSAGSRVPGAYIGIAVSAVVHRFPALIAWENQGNRRAPAGRRL